MVFLNDSTKTSQIFAVPTTHWISGNFFFNRKLHLLKNKPQFLLKASDLVSHFEVAGQKYSVDHQDYTQYL